MFLFQVEKLLGQFVYGTFSQKKTWKYLVTWFVYIAGYKLLADIVMASPEEFSGTVHPSMDMLLLKFSVRLVFFLCALCFCYKRNTDIDSEDFLQRYVCIAVPVSIRVGLVFMGVFVVKCLLDEMTFRGAPITTPSVSFDFWFEVLWSLAFQWKMVEAFKKMALIASVDVGGRVEVAQNSSEGE